VLAYCIYILTEKLFDSLSKKLSSVYVKPGKETVVTSLLVSIYIYELKATTLVREDKKLKLRTRRSAQSSPAVTMCTRNFEKVLGRIFLVLASLYMIDCSQVMATRSNPKLNSIYVQGTEEKRDWDC
jgi:hypothetical protein